MYHVLSTRTPEATEHKIGHCRC